MMMNSWCFFCFEYRRGLVCARLLIELENLKKLLHEQSRQLLAQDKLIAEKDKQLTRHSEQITS